MKLEVLCPAKVNLFLAVGPPDRKGYHPLRTVFQAVGLYDVLTLEPGEKGIQFSYDWPDMPAENTLTRAARLLAEVVDLPPLRVHLKKAIPAQSGLGGGSSDAAGLLRGFARLLGSKAAPHELASVAAAVGADVPFFLVGGRARGEGYGERLTPLEDGPKEWLVIARPEVGCSTPEMYRRLDELEREWRNFSDGDEVYNDFECVAPAESLALVERLRAMGARDALLSGSGSAVFGRFPGPSEAEHAGVRLLNEGIRCWVVPTLARAESLVVRRME